MTFVPDTRDNVQCAGQDCKNRDKCLRYLKRSGHNAWASFDIERKLYPGPCIHRVWFFKQASAA